MKPGKVLLRSITFAIFFTAIVPVYAQNQGRMDKIKSMIDSRNFIFEANEVSPFRGMSKQLSGGEYDIKVFGDTLISYLPYYGQASSAPMDPSQISIKFTSTHFTYEVKKHRKTWDVIISPTDIQDVRQMILSVFNNGYGTLQVNSINRDPITFSGYIVERKDKGRAL